MSEVSKNMQKLSTKRKELVDAHKKLKDLYHRLFEINVNITRARANLHKLEIACIAIILGVVLALIFNPQKTTLSTSVAFAIVAATFLIDKAYVLFGNTRLLSEADKIVGLTLETEDAYKELINEYMNAYDIISDSESIGINKDSSYFKSLISDASMPTFNEKNPLVSRVDSNSSGLVMYLSKKIISPKTAILIENNNEMIYALASWVCYSILCIELIADAHMRCRN